VKGNTQKKKEKKKRKKEVSERFMSTANMHAKCGTAPALT
jgi:hypothetical protein